MKNDFRTMTEGEKKARFTALLIRNGLSIQAAESVTGALAWRGKNRGYLKVRQPKGDTGAGGAWLAVMMEANPYKVDYSAAVQLPQNDREVFREMLDAIEEGTMGANLWKLDKDRVALEAAGAY